jgi:hypothetical protein
MVESLERAQMSPRKGFSSTANSPRERFEFLSSLRSIQNPPPVLDKGDLVASLAPIVMACFMDNKEPNKPHLLAKFDADTESREWLESLILSQASNLIEAGRDIGSHTTKVPNTSVSGPNGLFADPVISGPASGSDFVSSFTINSEKSVGAAGNAGRTRAYRLLTSSFSVGGQIVDLATDIASGGPLSMALVEMGFPVDTMEATRQNIIEGMNGEGANAVDSDAKVLMWPTGDGEYVAVTPVHAYAIHIEISNRLRSIRESNGWIKTREINVGGSKPQNGGLVNADLHGRHPHLTGYPPEAPTPESSLIWKIKNGHDIIKSYLPTGDEAASSFVKVVKLESWNNQFSRDILQRCIIAMAHSSLENVVAVRELMNSDEWERPLGEVVGQLPSWMASLVNGSLSDEPEDVVGKAVFAVAAAIVDMIGKAKNDDEGVTVDTALRSLIERTVADYIVTI